MQENRRMVMSKPGLEEEQLREGNGRKKGIATQHQEVYTAEQRIEENSHGPKSSSALPKRPAKNIVTKTKNIQSGGSAESKVSFKTGRTDTGKKQFQA